MMEYEFKKEDALRFADSQGIKTKIRGSELIFAECPYCGGKSKDKEKFAINMTTGQFNCFRASCRARGNMITLMKDFDFELSKELYEYYNRKRKFKSIAHYPRPEVRDPAIEYMKGRGISEEVVKKYSITTLKDNDNVIVFPFYDENNIMQFVKYRKADFDKEKDNNKEWSEKDCKPILFGMDQCNFENDTLIMTEGQIDSLSVAEAGIENAVSVPTGANGFTWVPYCWDFLGKFNTLIIFGDHEKGKITLLSDMKGRFHGMLKHVRPEDYQDCKDANELLQKHGKQAVIDAIQNAVAVRNPRIIEMADIVATDEEEEKISSGITYLDRTIGGFQMGTLVIVTGDSGYGKSTLASQFGTFALKQGLNTFFYSGEMRKWQVKKWLDRQIAGPDFTRLVSKGNGYDEWCVRDDTTKKINKWYKGRCFLYENSVNMSEGNETLLDVFKEAIKQCSCRVIIVDNLMTAMEDDLSSDLYRQQTSFIKKLVDMANAYNVLIILIAHLRKTSPGKGYSNDEIAGSSNIKNLCHLVLRYAKPKAGEADRILRIEKERITGRKSFEDVELWFDEASKRISEKPGEFSWDLGWADEDDKWVDADEYDEIPF